MASVIFSVLLSGCAAIQPDLTRMSTNLDKKISRLDQREKEIESAVKQANELISRQKKEVDQLVSETQAKLRREISELREEDLPKLRGMLDTNAHQITTLRAHVDDIQHRMATLRQQPIDPTQAPESIPDDNLSATVRSLEARLEAQEAILTELLGQVSKLAEQLKRQEIR